jgi:hypothetical protein
MKNYYLLLFLLVFWLCTENLTAQKFPYDVYDPRTLGELVERSSSTQEIKGSKQIMIDAKPYYSAVRVVYTGKSKPLTDEKRSLFKLWQESLQMDPRVLDTLESEYLFKECDKEYWVPVQKQVAGYFPKELKTGDAITLYLMLVGGIKNPKSWDIVFIVNEFRKYE